MRITVFGVATYANWVVLYARFGAVASAERVVEWKLLWQRTSEGDPRTPSSKQAPMVCISSIVSTAPVSDFTVFVDGTARAHAATAVVVEVGTAARPSSQLEVLP